jgi:hypothetical protein
MARKIVREALRHHASASRHVVAATAEQPLEGELERRRSGAAEAGADDLQGHHRAIVVPVK